MKLNLYSYITLHSPLLLGLMIDWKITVMGYRHVIYIYKFIFVLTIYAFMLQTVYA